MVKVIVSITLIGFIAMNHKQMLQTALLLIVTFLVLPIYAVCTTATVNGGSFGNVSAIDPDVSHYHLADIAVSCENINDAYLLGLNSGSLPVSGYRQLAHAGGRTIAYTLFQASSSTQWGDDGLTNTFPSPALPISGNGSNTYALYANAATNGKSTAGLYSDTVNVILKNSDTTTVTSTAHFNLYLDAFCTFNVSGFTSFGRYPVGHAKLTDVALGSISVTCPANISYKIGIDKGLHPSGMVRQMALNDTAFIPYSLKCNGVPWGDKGMNAININYVETSTENACSPLNTNGSPESFTISGSAEIQNATAIGTYTDTLIVTLVW
jgi:spore coat protein U-like protein